VPHIRSRKCIHVNVRRIRPCACEFHQEDVWVSEVGSIRT
jgi:hypothetical protein